MRPFPQVLDFFPCKYFPCHKSLVISRVAGGGDADGLAVSILFIVNWFCVAEHLNMRIGH
jgi:hypothetical protein